jgi:hypothetical protein
VGQFYIGDLTSNWVNIQSALTMTSSAIAAGGNHPGHIARLSCPPETVCNPAFVS